MQQTRVPRLVTGKDELLEGLFGQVLLQTFEVLALPRQAPLPPVLAYPVDALRAG